MVCPSCHEKTHLGYHASYVKYLYDEQIIIIRLLCKKCKITHALIPSFSLPGTSIGTMEAESYLQARAQGVSRSKAGQCFIKQGMSTRYPIHFETMIEHSIVNIKALIPNAGNIFLDGLSYLESITGTGKQVSEDRLFITVNDFCLGKSVNAVFCNRVSILVFDRRKPGIIYPLNTGSMKDKTGTLDSS